MGYQIKLKITASNTKDFQLYIYRSTNSENINTLAKVKNMMPTLILDETKASSLLQENTYIITDSDEPQEGIIYNGPIPNAIPSTEYEMKLSAVTVDFNYYTTLELVPLEVNYNGVLYFYSIVGVRGDQITHLSSINSVILKSDYQKTGSREILSCENYTGEETDEWTRVTVCDWNEDIIIGDCSNNNSFHRFGSPFISTVHCFSPEEILVNNRCTNTFNHNEIRIPNVWRFNNKTYNYRKLKSFKICNLDEGLNGAYSEPTMQTELPLPIEKMIVLKKDITKDLSTMDTPLPLNDFDSVLLTIIRKDGVYYNSSEHKNFSLNAYTIDTKKEHVAIYSESSIQEYIALESEAFPSKIYQYTIYLQDGYGAYSEPINFTVQS